MPFSKKAANVHSALTEIVEHKEGIVIIQVKRAKELIKLLNGTDNLTLLASRILQDLVSGRPVSSELYSQVPEHVKLPVRTHMLLKNLAENKEINQAELLLLKMLEDKSWLNPSKLWARMAPVLDEVNALSKSVSTEKNVGLKSRIASLNHTVEIMLNHMVCVYYCQLLDFIKKDICLEGLEKRLADTKRIDLFELHVKVVNDFLEHSKKKPYFRSVSDMLLTRVGPITKPYLVGLSNACSVDGNVDGLCQIVRKLIFLDIPVITGKDSSQPRDIKTNFYQAVRETATKVEMSPEYYTDLLDNLASPPPYNEVPSSALPLFPDEPTAPEKKGSLYDTEALRRMMEDQSFRESLKSLVR